MIMMTCTQCAKDALVFDFRTAGYAVPTWSCGNCGALHYDSDKYSPVLVEGVTYVRRGASNVVAHPVPGLDGGYGAARAKRREICAACGKEKVRLEAKWSTGFELRPSVCVFCEREYFEMLIAHVGVRILIGPVQG